MLKKIKEKWAQKKKNDIYYAMQNAVQAGDIKKTYQLLEKGVDVNRHNDKGLSLLHIACSKKNTDMAKLLINAGADIHAHHELALRLSIEQNDVKTLDLLIEKGADINVQRKSAHSDDEINILSYACLLGHTNCAKKLILAGAKIKNTQCYEIAMNTAVKNDAVDMINFLNKIDKDNEISIPNETHYAIIDYACLHGKSNGITALCENDKIINALTQQNWLDCLFTATYQNHNSEVSKCLYEKAKQHCPIVFEHITDKKIKHPESKEKTREN